jgi:alpha-L-fucosidase
MDFNLYEGIKHYIQNHQPPRGISNEVRNTIFRTAHNYHLRNNILYWINNNENRRVAKITELETILHNGHSSPQAGHFNANATYHRLHPLYYWPRMYKSIENYIQQCDVCQRRGKPKRTDPLHPIPVREIFDMWGIDIVGPLPETENGNKYIIVAVEYLTKFPEALPLKDIKAKTVAQFIYDQIICRYGAPKVILTDQGASFRNEIIDALCESVNTNHKLATAYHPQTNGLVERFNKTLCETIAKYMLQYKNRQWDYFVQSAILAYRTKIQTTTKFDPFFLMYGRKAKLPISIMAHEGETEEEELFFNIEQHVEVTTTLLEHTRNIARQRITQAQQKQKERFDKKIKVREYQIGEQVLLYKSNEENIHGDKFREMWLGPYYIQEKLGNGAYKLRDPDNNIGKKLINGARLKKFHAKPNWESIIYIENTR